MKRYLPLVAALVGCLGLNAQERSGPVFRVKVDMVVLSFTVTDSKGRYVTGLKPEVDLSTEDVSRHISRRHARITYREDKFFLSEEVGAMNGTFLNGEKITQQGVLYPIEDGDRISLCQIHLVFHKV